MPRPFVLVLGALVLFASSSALADTSADKSVPAAPQKRVLGILDIRGTTGESAAAFEAELEKKVASTNFWIAPRAKMRERLRESTKWADGCVAGPCLAEARVQTQAEIVLLATLTGSDTTFGYVVTLVRTDTGTVVSQDSERCDVCTQNEAQSAASDAVVALLNALPDPLPSPTGPAVVDASEHERELARARRPRKIAAGLTVLGLVAIGVGTVLYVTNDDRPKAMLATAAAGGGLLASGVVILTF